MKTRSIKNFNNIIFFVSVFLLFSKNFSLNIHNRFKNSKNNLALNTKTNSKQFTSLTINPLSGKSGVINLKIKNQNLIHSIGLINKKFTINSKEYDHLIADNKEVNLKGKSILTNSLNVQGNVVYNGTNQWRMAAYDTWDNSSGSQGWSFTKTTKCGMYTMLGGKCQLSNKEIVKTLTNLPEHTMIRIEGLFHFMGNWESETGYLKLWNETDYKKLENSKKYLWTMRCKKSKKVPLIKIDICDEPSCKIASLINVTIPHREKMLKISFGSSIKGGNACEKSYGISDIKFYIR